MSGMAVKATNLRPGDIPIHWDRRQPIARVYTVQGRTTVVMEDGAVHDQLRPLQSVWIEDRR